MCYARLILYVHRTTHDALASSGALGLCHDRDAEISISVLFVVKLHFCTCVSGVFRRNSLIISLFNALLHLARVFSCI